MEQQEMITWAYIVIAAIGVIGFTYILQLAVRMLGNSVPQSAIEGIMNRVIDTALIEVKRMTDATPNKVDDGFVNALIERQKANATGAIVPATPTLPAPTPPTVTISEYPQQPVVTTPPYNPAIPIKENKYLAPYENRLDFPQGRQVHVPVNMGYVFECRDLSGKEYPHPNVNINTAYGARFDVGFIAGSWGLSYLTTFVKGVEYKVAVDYSAEVTGDKISTLSDWLWWELDLDNKPTDHVNKGISNGARNVAEWTVIGTGEPVIVTPRIRAAWASASNNSAVIWHNLTITPVELAG